MKYASNFDHQTVFVIYYRPIDIETQFAGYRQPNEV